jgi:hypothetical protein
MILNMLIYIYYKKARSISSAYLQWRAVVFLNNFVFVYMVKHKDGEFSASMILG